MPGMVCYGVIANDSCEFLLRPCSRRALYPQDTGVMLLPFPTTLVVDATESPGLPGHIFFCLFLVDSTGFMVSIATTQR